MADGRSSSRGATPLGDVQRTLFIPLAARAAETRRRRPALRDPKAVEVMESADFDPAAGPRGSGGVATVVRTLIFDWWVREFLAEHPAGTVVELGTGLNSRFERVDNGQAHWIDLDLPDTIGLRRRFFADTERRQMLAASVLDGDWHEAAAARPAPYFFVSEGVLVYLDKEKVKASLSATARRFPGSAIALDTYSRRMFGFQHRMAARRGIAPWAWHCDDPRELEGAGLRLVESVPVSRPPGGLRRELPPRYRYLMPLTDPVLGKAFALSLFRAAG